MRRQRRAGKALDARNHVPLGAAREGDGDAARTGTTGAADAMDVVLGAARQIEVDHMGHIADVDTACSDVGGDEQSQ